MCARDSTACLSNDNGCPSSLSYRCEANGVCKDESSGERDCKTTYELMNAMALSTTSEDLCENHGQVACFSGNGIMYCADTINECI